MLNFLKLKEIQTKKELKQHKNKIYKLVKGDQEIGEDKKVNPFF
jgi:hypothetical protein